MVATPNATSRLVFITFAALALSSPVSALNSYLRKNVEPQQQGTREEEQAHRELDTAWTLPPTEEPTVRPAPTRNPTPRPSRNPTRSPTHNPTPTGFGDGPGDICGTIQYGDGSGLILGQFEDRSYQRTPETFECNADNSGHWYYAQVYDPMDAYRFQVTEWCEYQYRGPMTNDTFVSLRDVNSFFEQMAITLKRRGHVGYKASDDDIIFSGVSVPNYDYHVITENIDDCPETYCVKIFGPAVSRRSLGENYPQHGADNVGPDLDRVGNNGSPSEFFPLGVCEGDCDRDSDCQEGLVCKQRNNWEHVIGCNNDSGDRKTDYCFLPPEITGDEDAILYAFSSEDAWEDFKWQFKLATIDSDAEHIFYTNHFLRCGCESFCYEDDKHWDAVPFGATCYVEHLCGQHVFQVKYKDDYPEELKASWASEGTTEVLEWFDECATAMYGCTEVTDFDKSLFEGTFDDWHDRRYKGFPKAFTYDVYEISPFPELESVGNNNLQSLLKNCEGDCDRDSDCEPGLICMQRNNYEHVPGCDNDTGDSHTDYCYVPPHLDPNLPMVTYIGNNGSPADAFPLGLCEGDCDRDSECEGDLVCFQRNDLTPIPGCAGVGHSGDDICYNPDVDSAPSEAPTATVSIAQYYNVYGLGGDKYYGFPGQNDGKPSIAWSCPNFDHRSELERFGEYVAATEFFRIPGTDQSVPDVPCPDESFYEPQYPELVDPVGPSCDDIEEHVYCYQMEGATCYAKTTEETCNGVEFFMINQTSTYSYDNVAVWHDDCIGNGNECRRIPGWDVSMDGNFTHAGKPFAFPGWAESYGWQFNLMNRIVDGQDTLTGNNKIIYYDCEDWIGSYRSRNFTEGAGDGFEVFGNLYGDLYMNVACTDSPTATPSVYPTTTHVPTGSPSQSPTLCSESYLSSEDLNIALVIDLSFSTYEKEFSAENPVGDLNNDGKANTILDAQIAAVQELLVAIAESPRLRNSNSEINLISFSTDAQDHGVFDPLNASDDDYNSDLMDYIKENLWAPTSSNEVRVTNNGFTNFDAALDVAVEYFTNTATPGRKDLLVFLSDGEPNVRGDGDSEGYCSESATFWVDGSTVACEDLGLAPGERHDFCRGDDTGCAQTEAYQDCVRGPNECMNVDAVTQYQSEIDALTELNVERLAIGVGNESNIEYGSALWMIDNNPAKHLGVLPLQALDLDELSEYLSSLCILNTEPPTGSPSASPSAPPTVSPAPTSSPSELPSSAPSSSPSAPPTTPAPTTPSPTSRTPPPTTSPSSVPTVSPSVSPSVSPTMGPTTSSPSDSPTVAPVVETLPPHVTHSDDSPDGGIDYDCPSDIHLLNQVGTTPLPDDTIRILEQNTTHVKVEVRQSFTPDTAGIDEFFYQHGSFRSNTCYEKGDFVGGDTVIIIAECRIGSPIAVLNFWFVDDLSNGVLTETDDATVPKCCHSTAPEGTPTTHYAVYVNCESACPGATE